MIIKYRVHEVAKDFNVPSKEVIEIIMAATGAEKKHMTALNEDELNVVFEHFSRNKQVESFNEYLAGKLDIKTANDKRKREKEEIASEEAKPTEKEVKTAVKPSAKKDSDNGKGSAEKTSPLVELLTPAQHRLILRSTTRNMIALLRRR